MIFVRGVGGRADGLQGSSVSRREGSDFGAGETVRWVGLGDLREFYLCKFYRVDSWSFLP